MTDNVTVVRSNAKLRETDAKLVELEERWSRIGLPDRSALANQEISFVQPAPQHARARAGHDAGRSPATRVRGAHYKGETSTRASPTRT